MLAHLLHVPGFVGTAIEIIVFANAAVSVLCNAASSAAPVAAKAATTSAKVFFVDGGRTSYNAGRKAGAWWFSTVYRLAGTVDAEALALSAWAAANPAATADRWASAAVVEDLADTSIGNAVTVEQVSAVAEAATIATADVLIVGLPALGAKAGRGYAAARHAVGQVCTWTAVYWVLYGVPAACAATQASRRRLAYFVADQFGGLHNTLWASRIVSYLA